MEQNKFLWRDDFTVDGNDVDENGIVKQSVLIRYIEHGIFMQHRTFGPTIESLRSEKDMAFVLSRISGRIDEEIVSGDRLRVETFASEPKGFTFLRFGRIFRDDKLVAEYEMTWALVKLTERTLVKGSELNPGFGFLPEADVKVSLRPRFPRDLEPVCFASHRVGYHEADENRHMNNTYYPDLFCSAVDMKGKRISEFSLSYLREASLGAEFDMLCGEKDGLVYVFTRLDSGEKGAEACFRFAGLPGVGE